VELVRSGIADRLARNLAGARHLAENLGNRARQFFRGGATVPTLFEELSGAAPTVAARALASLAVAVIDCAVVACRRPKPIPSAP